MNDFNVAVALLGGVILLLGLFSDRLEASPLSAPCTMKSSNAGSREQAREEQHGQVRDRSG
jgi:hypothetical protein